MLCIADTPNPESKLLGDVTRPDCADASLYGILRRIAPALKHDMVVHLQAVAMRAEVLAVRLEKGLQPSADLQKDLMAVHRLSRDAVANCLDVMSWIEPADDEGIELSAGIRECVAVVQGSFGLSGHQIVVNSCERKLDVSRVALRNLLTAALLTGTDERRSGCDVLVDCDVAGGYAVVRVRIGPVREQQGEHHAALIDTPARARRQLDWADVQALARAHSAELSRTRDIISLQLPRHTATTPLKIAPL